LTSAAAWHVFGALAAVLTASVWRVFAPACGNDAAAAAARATTTAPIPANASGAVATHSAFEVATLAFAYGISGFGYIVTATFLPVIARAALPADSPWLDLFWPIFGAGVILGALLATRVRVSGDLRVVLAGAYLVQSVAIAIGLALPTAAGFALGSFLLGLPFTAITYFALQEVRRLRPHQVAATTGLVTALWSIGQTAGPPMVALLLQRTTGVGAAFTLSLLVAAGALVAGAVVFFASSRLWPRSMGG
jgi:predicted MFS family arabinose efflux permease